MLKLINVLGLNKNLMEVKLTSFYMLLFNFIAIFFLIQFDAYAMIFSNGQPRVFVDVNQPLEDFFGGFDLRDPNSPDASGPTSMTFTTQNLVQNNINSAVGGSFGTATRGSIINGNTNIIMHNTQCNFIYGGGYSEGPDAVVTGTSNISVYNSRVIDIFGGGYDPGGHIGHTSVGGVKILVDNSEVQNLTGSSSSVGIQQQGRYAVFGNVDIAVKNGSRVTNLIGTSESSAHIKGNLSISVEQSQVDNLHCIDHAVLDGDLSLSIGNGAVVNNVFLSTESPLGGKANFDINGGFVNHLRFGPYAGTLNESTIIMKSGRINWLDITAGTPGGVLKGVDIFMEGGSIARLNLCPTQGTSLKSTLHMNGGVVENLQVGSNAGLNGMVHFARIEARDGVIEQVEHLPGVLNSDLVFIPGGNSTLYGVLPGGSFSNVIVQPDARTFWGRAGNNRFVIESDNFDLGGTIVIPSAENTIELVVNNHLIAHDGIFEIIDVDRSRQTPFIVFTGNPGSSVEILQPLNAYLSLPKSFLGTSGIPLAQATPNLANSKLFSSTIHKGLIWGDISFDASSNTWFINNLRESRDYYGYLSMQGASNWLRQQHILTTQRRSAHALLNKHDGLWVDVQAGHEKIDVKLGRSKMPWVMASAGYDYRHNISEKVAMLYGFAFGFGDGHQKWTLANKIKNRLTMGLLDGYVGVSLNSGLYGIVALQGSVNNIKTKNPGFAVDKTLTEVVPTESLELGWNYAFNELFSIMPRAQIILEQLPRHKFGFTSGIHTEEIKIRKNTTVTTLAGILANYNIERFNIHGSVDWIKGVSGTYKVHSMYFDKTFKDKNNNNVLRAALGCEFIIRENMNIGVNVFGDMIDNKGIGGQATFSYKF